MGKDISAKSLFYGINESVNLKGKVIENNISGLSIEIDGYEMTSRLIGEFNAYNLLARLCSSKNFRGKTLLLYLQLLAISKHLKVGLNM